MTTNEKQNKQPEAGKKELTPRQIQMRKKMVVFPLFFLAFAAELYDHLAERERRNTAQNVPDRDDPQSDGRRVCGNYF